MANFTKKDRARYQQCPQLSIQDRIKVDENGCWIWQGSLSDPGYGRLQIDGNRLYAHRVAYTLFVGDIPKSMFVCHSCDVPACVNPEHLFLGDQKTNMADAAAKGRIASGQRKPKTTKLTDDQVREIRKLFSEGTHYRVIAARFRISEVYVYELAGRRKRAGVAD